MVYARWVCNKKMLTNAEPALKKCVFAFLAWVWRIEITGKAVEKLLTLLSGFRPSIRPLYATQTPVYIWTMSLCNAEGHQTSNFHLLFWNKTWERQSCQLAKSSAAFLKKAYKKESRTYKTLELFDVTFNFISKRANISKGQLFFFGNGRKAQSVNHIKHFLFWGACARKKLCFSSELLTLFLQIRHA